MIHLTDAQLEQLFTEFAPLDEQERVNKTLAMGIEYKLAPQHCLMCNIEVPFVPFKDPICDECCKPAF